MSNTKPSRAAMELGARLAFVAYGPYMQTLNSGESERAITPYAELVQRSVTDLLEKAEASLEHLENGGYYETHRDLKSALEPWEPEKT